MARKSSAPAGTNGRGQRLYDWLKKRCAKDQRALAAALARNLPRMVDEGECIPWRGQINLNGYGNFCAWLNASKKVTFYAHQIFWTLANRRPIPDDMEIDHTCDNPSCVNPAHLQLVTRQHNLSRRDERQRNKNGGGTAGAAV